MRGRDRETEREKERERGERDQDRERVHHNWHDKITHCFGRPNAYNFR